MPDNSTSHAIPNSVMSDSLKSLPLKLTSDAHYLLSISFMVLSASYYLLTPRFSMPKQAAWILTTISSAIMTLASLPFFYDYLRHEGSVKAIRMRPELSIAINRFFQSYLTADLFIGALHYRSQINLLTGWIHHVLYILVVEVAVRCSWAHILCLCSIMEIPTFTLGIMTLNPLLRNNALFALAFFLTRIVFHVVLAVAYFRTENRVYATNGSFVPALVLTVIFSLHVVWFHGWINGFLRGHAEHAIQSAVPVVSFEIVSAGSSVSIAEPLKDIRIAGAMDSSTSGPRLRATPLASTHREQPRPFVPRAQHLFQIYHKDGRTAASVTTLTKMYGTIPSRGAVYDYVGLGTKTRIRSERKYAQPVDY